LAGRSALGPDDTVRARSGRLSALSVFYSKSGFYGGFVCARRALHRQKTGAVGPAGQSLADMLNSFAVALKAEKELDEALGAGCGGLRLRCVWSFWHHL
jgi:hypothetical protein